MSVEGRLSIRLFTENARVNRAKISSNRPVHAARVFINRELNAVQKMLPLLFSVCGTAQACASVRACEQAQGRLASPQLELLRDRLVNLETIREHYWRILLDWPGFLDLPTEQTQAAAMLRLQNELRQSLTRGSNPFLGTVNLAQPQLDTLASQTEQLNFLLEQQVYGMPPDQWLTISSLTELDTWAKGYTQLAPRLIRKILDSGWSDIARTRIPALPELKSKQFLHLMKNADFEIQPQWRDECCESSSLTRTRSPLLTQLGSPDGYGLLCRLVARLTELAQITTGLATQDTDSDHTVLELEAFSVQNRGPGIGRADAARGCLIHRVELEGNTVRDYRIVAPTEWNFHPEGVVKQALLTLSGEPSVIESQARILINAVDPCVAYELSVQ